MKRDKKQNIVSSVKTSFLWLVSAAFLAGTIFITIESSSSSATLTHVEAIEANLKEENQTLRDYLIKNSSLIVLSQSAEKLGFIRPENIVYLNKEEPVAKLPTQ